MGNLGKEEQPLEIVLRDGNTYKLAPLDLNLMGEIQSRFEGKPFSSLFREGDVNPIKALFHVRLREFHPELTEDQVGRLVTAKSMALLTKDLEDQLGIVSEE